MRTDGLKVYNEDTDSEFAKLVENKSENKIINNFFINYFILSIS